MTRTRLVIGAAGIALGGFGVFRLLTEISNYNLEVLFCWLVGALVIHDGILSPLVVSVGVALRRFVPDRARRYLQFGLIAGGLVTVIAIPMIYRRDSQPAVKAILQQNFGANLATLLAIVAGLAIMLYVAQLVRDRQAISAVNGRPSQDQTEPTE